MLNNNDELKSVYEHFEGIELKHSLITYLGGDPKKVEKFKRVIYECHIDNLFKSKGKTKLVIEYDPDFPHAVISHN